MDDSCAVCAENLEWVAYGPCGHKDVCSTCVVRLRFICDDRHCCICKHQSQLVFVTKAMGGYTRTISDFAATFPAQPREGQVGSSLWYHEDTQAYFDDVEHYKMVKAMCRLSCSVCDKAAAEEHSEDGGGNGGSVSSGSGSGGYRRRQRFRDIRQLKAHLDKQHRRVMCDLCLEGRKVFICEQKLYTKAQLNQHRKTGDTEVDGTESERGGFAGHPMCEFCLTYFYGENELYTHMSTEHFTCHICQRRHPGQFEYYSNYDNLENHFRHSHFLCEDEACLAKKFIVFQTTEDLKRHNAMEHGGRMSRSKRSAVLQIPTSFRYRSNNESGYHRGRRRSFLREPAPDGELSAAIQASLDRTSGGDTLPDASSSLAAAASVRDSEEPSDIDSLVQPFESVSTMESESSRYRQAVSHSSTNAPLGGSSFPPLPSASSSQQKSQQESQNTMAARLRRQNNAAVLNVARRRPATSAARPAPAISAPPSAATAPVARSSATPAPFAPSSAAPAPVARSTAPTLVARPAAPTPAPVRVPVTSALQPAPAIPAPQPAQASPTPWPALGPSSGSVQSKPPSTNGSGSSSYATSLHGRSVNEPSLGKGGSWVSKSTSSGGRLNHSTSAPNLMENRSFDPVSDFPPVSAAHPNSSRSRGQANKKEDVQTANKSLVERMRAALDYDENKYSAFKEISQEYRQDLIDTWEYIEYVKQFDLTHLIPDLARLCPDVDKQQELLQAYRAATQSDGSQDNLNGSGSSRKDKGKKVVDSENRHTKQSLADNVISSVRSLQSQFKPSEEVEVLEKDGYRSSREKSTTTVGEGLVELRGSRQPTPATGSNNRPTSIDGGGGSKQKKKTSKFHRLRLGEDSPAAILDVSNPTTDSMSAEMGTTSGWPNPSEGLSTRGVWGRGGHRLFAN